MEEPVCEPPAIALYYVSKLAKDYVKVLLSGEGGDEAFAGYQNYRSTVWLEAPQEGPRPVPRGAASSGLGQVNGLLKYGKAASSCSLLNEPFDSYYYSQPPVRFPTSTAPDEMICTALASRTNKAQSLQVVTDYLAAAKNFDLLSKMLYVDTKTWLTDDLLLKADKMTMANSIELRVPLLDHKLLEFGCFITLKL